MLDDLTLGAVRDAMDASSLRHQVLATNIANAKTPGYQPRDVTFHARVRQLREGEIGDAGPTATVGIDVAARSAPSDGVACVDTQREIADMTDNAIRYQSLAQLANARLHILQTIAHDGRR